MSDDQVSSSFWSPDVVFPRRSLLLCALGAVAGLLIAGFGLFTAQGTRIAGIPAEDAAIVNAVPILRADLIQQVEATYALPSAQVTATQRRKVLDNMIREELHVQRGVETGMANDDVDVRATLVAASEAQVAQDALTALPTEDELHRWYAEHRDAYASPGMMHVDEWLLPASTRAPDRVAEALRNGVAPAALGLHGSGRMQDADEFYFAARIHLGPALFAVARELKNGQISNPIRQADGFHILQMIRNQPPQPTAYGDVRDKVAHDLLAAKIAGLEAAEDRFLRRRADIRVAEGLH